MSLVNYWKDLKNALVTHLDRNDLISDSQHGFMQGKSCTTNLLIMLEALTSSIDNGSAFDTIFYDFAKAFERCHIHG